MKGIFTIGLILLLHSISVAMEQIQNFGDNPGNLNMYLHAPENLEGISAVVVAIHGCTQDAHEIAEQSGWNELADRYNFIVIYPEQKRSNNVSNCFNWFNKKDHSRDEGELYSILQMIKKAKNMYEIDSESIYIYGVSAGAAMANSLLANNPSSYAAGAVFAGGPYGGKENTFQRMKTMMDPKDRTPMEWGEGILSRVEKNVPKMVVVHGTKDNVVHLQNAAELIDQWSYVHGISPEPANTDLAYNKNAKVHRYSYCDEDDLERIVYYELQGVGHKLPVDPGEAVHQGGQMKGRAVDIDFFSTYYIAKEFGLIM